MFAIIIKDMNWINCIFLRETTRRLVLTWISDPLRACLMKNMLSYADRFTSDFACFNLKCRHAIFCNVDAKFLQNISNFASIRISTQKKIFSKILNVTFSHLCCSKHYHKCHNHKNTNFMSIPAKLNNLFMLQKKIFLFKPQRAV